MFGKNIHFSPLTKRRLAIFSNNRRAKWSLYIFCCLFFLSLFAEFISNDKPVVVYFDGQLYFPVVKRYPETTFDGDFETEAVYNDPFVIELIENKGWMLWPINRYSYDTIVLNETRPAPSSPTKQNWLGTDDQKRDVVARVIYGFRISVLFGLSLTIVSSIIGIFIGALQGYFGGKVDLIGQRLLEIWGSLPALYILIILASIIKPNFTWLLVIMILVSWPALVDLVRAEFLRSRNFEYVRAAKALGVSDKKIMYRHILPNAMVATMTYMPFIFAGAITTLTALDFLGFGMPSGSPSLGELVLQGKANLHASWLGITAFTVLSLILTLVVFVGEGVRDAFDPRVSI